MLSLLDDNVLITAEHHAISQLEIVVFRLFEIYIHGQIWQAQDGKTQEQTLYLAEAIAIGSDANADEHATSSIFKTRGETGLAEQIACVEKVFAELVPIDFNVETRGQGGTGTIFYMGRAAFTAATRAGRGVFRPRRSPAFLALVATSLAQMLFAPLLIGFKVFGSLCLLLTKFAAGGFQVGVIDLALLLAGFASLLLLSLISLAKLTSKALSLHLFRALG